MKIKEYQEFTETTAMYPKVQKRPEVIATMYCALGLAGEVGEVVEHIKKWHRDDHINAEEVTAELGDVFYYLFRLCDELGLSAERVMEMNVRKLQDRKQRGVI